MNTTQTVVKLGIKRQVICHILMTICIRLFETNVVNVKPLDTDLELGREIMHSVTENKEKVDTSERGEFMRGRRRLKEAPFIRSTVVNMPLHNNGNCQCLTLHQENSADNTTFVGKEHCC